VVALEHARERRVTERNAGRLTAGVDGQVVLTPEAKMQLLSRIQHPTEPFNAMPVRRVYIPKPAASGARSGSTGAILIPCTPKGVPTTDAVAPALACRRAVRAGVVAPATRAVAGLRRSAAPASFGDRHPRAKRLGSRQRRSRPRVSRGPPHRSGHHRRCKHVQAPSRSSRRR
jgi:hypothetical protein